MKKIILAVLLSSCSVFSMAVPAAKQSAEPSSYTPEQKKELLDVVGTSADMFGYAKASFLACPTPKKLLDRYDAALNKYQAQLKRYSFGEEAVSVYSSRLKAAYSDLSAKLESQDKQKFCNMLAPEVEPTIVKLEKSLQEGEQVKDPYQTGNKPSNKQKNK